MTNKHVLVQIHLFLMVKVQNVQKCQLLYRNEEQTCFSANSYCFNLLSVKSSKSQLLCRNDEKTCFGANLSLFHG